MREHAVALAQGWRAHQSWAQAFADMQGHALREGPKECCGLLVKDAGGMVVVVSMLNIASDPEHNFEMNPTELMHAFRTYPEIIGSYHSHPTGPPQPSSTDLEFAHPNLRNWLVCDGKVMEWSQDGLIVNA